MIRYLFSIFIVIFLFVMCSKDNRDVISMKEFKSEILDSDTTVLDVRTEEEFYGPLGHIEGAILIPIDDLEGRVGELNSVKNEIRKETKNKLATAQIDRARQQLF